MNKTAIFHKMDKEYFFALSKDNFLIKLRTAKNDLVKIRLGYCDKYLNERKIPIEGNIKYVDMIKVASDDLFDYYEAKINIHMIVCRYFFELTDFENNVLYYYGYRFYKEEPTLHFGMFDASQPVREEEIFDVPSWANGAIVYQIFPERFARKNLNTERNWYTAPMTRNEVLGGNLRGIIDSLGYLEQLGIEVIYLTPIFKSSSTHKYNTDDYMEIDSSFGNEDDLKELVEKAHSKNIKVILDGVFNHSGYEFAPFVDLMKNQETSKFKDWYYPFSFPLKWKWGEKPNYWTFGYAGPMPKLNTSNPEVREYIFNVIRKWMALGIDGWRLDVADEVSHDFWKAFRKVVKSINKDALIIGEVWYESSPWLLGYEYDTVMNYLFFDNVKKLLITKEYKVSDFDNENNFLRGRMHTRVQPLLWNLIDSHDTPRFLTQANANNDILKLAFALQMTLPGMPMIYYGDEVGMQGGGDPDCRRGMLWDEEKQNKDILDYYKKWIKIHKKYSSLKNGEFKSIYVNDDAQVYIFKRFNEFEELYIAFNFSNNNVSLDLLNDKQVIDELDSKLFIKPMSCKIFK